MLLFSPHLILAPTVTDTFTNKDFVASEQNVVVETSPGQVNLSLDDTFYMRAYTGSTFPITGLIASGIYLYGAGDASQGLGSGDVTVARLIKDPPQIQTIKAYGGAGDDQVNGICADSSYLYIVGHTTTGTAGNTDAMLLKVSIADLSLSAATRIGGAMDEQFVDCVADGTNVYAVGFTYSMGGIKTGYVTKLAASNLGILAQKVIGNGQPGDFAAIGADSTYLYVAGTIGFPSPNILIKSKANVSVIKLSKASLAASQIKQIGEHYDNSTGADVLVDGSSLYVLFQRKLSPGITDSGLAKLSTSDLSLQNIIGFGLYGTNAILLLFSLDQDSTYVYASGWCMSSETSGGEYNNPDGCFIRQQKSPFGGLTLRFLGWPNQWQSFAPLASDTNYLYGADRYGQIPLVKLSKTFDTKSHYSNPPSVIYKQGTITSYSQYIYLSSLSLTSSDAILTQSSLSLNSANPAVTLSNEWKSFANEGTLTSANLLPSIPLFNTISSFSYTASKDSNNVLQGLFSHDGTNWVNSNNQPVRQQLSNGAGAIDLSGLNWVGQNFYYKAFLGGGVTGPPKLFDAGVTYLPNKLYADEPCVPSGACSCSSGNACTGSSGCVQSNTCAAICDGTTPPYSTPAGNNCAPTANDCRCSGTCSAGSCSCGTVGWCSYSCNAGRSNCNDNSVDGCECQTPSNCCGGVGSNTLYFNCNSCSGTSCATCGAASCSAQVCGQASYCSVSSCVACSANQGNCDGDASNGCEATTSRDANNCGSCGNACPDTNGACGEQNCIAGSCGSTIYNPGQYSGCVGSSGCVSDGKDSVVCACNIAGGCQDTCGDSVCQAWESYSTCPGDCPLFSRSCEVKEGCGIAEDCIFSVFPKNDSHAAQCNYFQYSVCCSGMSKTDLRTIRCQGNEAPIIRFFQENDTHAEAPNESIYAWVVCGNACSCSLKDTCDSSEFCMVSMSSSKNAHLGECGYFGKQLCCECVEPPSVSLIAPVQNAVDTTFDILLNVSVSDSLGGEMNVTFYNGTNVLIKLHNIPDSTNASFFWQGLHRNATFSWHVVVNGSRNSQTVSDTWQFTTTKTPVQCSISPECSAEEMCMFSVYKGNDTHIGECSYFDLSVCCPGVKGIAVRDSICDPGEKQILRSYQANDAHVEFPGRADYNTAVCGWNCSCSVKPTCSANELCVVSLFNTTNSHVGECNYFGNNICCRCGESVFAEVTVTDPRPVGSSTGVSSNPELSAKVVNSAGLDSAMEFFYGLGYDFNSQSSRVYKGTGGMPTALHPAGETLVARTDNLTADDSLYVLAESPSEQAYQHFVFSFDEDPDEIAAFKVDWNGNTNLGNTLGMYVWSFTSNSWAVLQTRIGTAADINISAEIVSDITNFTSAGEIHFLMVDTASASSRVATDFPALKIFRKKSLAGIGSGARGAVFVTDLAGDTRYYWYATAADRWGNKGVSETWWFETTTLPVVDNVILDGNADAEGHTNDLNLTYAANGTGELFEVIDYRVSNLSIAVLNLPFQVDHTESNFTRDFSTFENHGRVHGASWTRFGLLGGGYVFDGADDFIDVPHSSTLDLESFSVEAWVRSDALPSSSENGYIVAHLGYSNPNWFGYALAISPSTGRAFLGTYDGHGTGTQVLSFTNVADGNWHHIVGIHRPGKNRIYVDGVLENTAPAEEPDYPFALPLRIGGATHAAGYFQGSIDEVRVYRRAMPESEVMRLYSDTVNYRHDLVLNMLFINNILSGIVPDYSEHENNGTLGGGNPEFVPAWSPERGGSYVFDEDYIGIGDKPSLDLANQFSIVVWAKDP